jgi:peptidoglycan/LPS O-acetylase OafA/YrhL
MSASLKYRPDIDGLRAVAVLGVIIFHAFPKALPGGFTGVDIFFVISGYLISGILYKGHREGNFRFREFYARRIRRLFPSLITVLLLSLAYGWLVLLPDEYEKLGKHVAAGTLFIQNMVFWKEIGYFDVAVNLKPMLHLWSLAVEEQFYIFFPPILLLIWKKKWPLAAIMGVLLIGTFIGNVVMSHQDAVTDFFLTPYRAWEFLGGSLLAWWHYDRGHEEEALKHRDTLSWAGATLMLLGMTVLTKAQPYPGWRALLPVAGTLLVIEGGGSAWVNRRILSHPAMVHVGLISYPLYLFHWPALSFLHIVKGQAPPYWMITVALGVALLLTLATYHGIEKRIRHNKSRWTLPCLIVAFLATGLLGWLAWDGRMGPKVPETMVKTVNAIRDRHSREGLRSVMGKNGHELFIVGGDGAQTLFVGDSNMEQYAPRIVGLLHHKGAGERGAIFAIAAGVPPIDEITTPSNPSCSAFIPWVKTLLGDDKRIDRVVISAFWYRYFTPGSAYSCRGTSLGQPDGRDRALQNFSRLLGELRGQGKQVVVVKSIPFGPPLDPKGYFKRGFLEKTVMHHELLSVKEFQAVYAPLEISDRMSEIALENGARIIDPTDFLSENGICIAEDKDGPIRHDYDHLRPGFVRGKVEYLDSFVVP